MTNGRSFVVVSYEHYDDFERKMNQTEMQVARETDGCEAVSPQKAKGGAPLWPM